MSRAPEIVAKLARNSPTILHRPRRNRYRFFGGWTTEKAHFLAEKRVFAVAYHGQNR